MILKKGRLVVLTWCGLLLGFCACSPVTVEMVYGFDLFEFSLKSSKNLLWLLRVMKTS